MCMIQSVSIMSCSVDSKAHSVAPVRAPTWCKPLEIEDWRGAMCTVGADFHKLFHSFCEDRVTRTG